MTECCYRLMPGFERDAAEASVVRPGDASPAPVVRRGSLASGR